MLTAQYFLMLYIKIENRVHQQLLQNLIAIMFAKILKKIIKNTVRFSYHDSSMSEEIYSAIQIILAKLASSAILVTVAYFQSESDLKEIGLALIINSSFYSISPIL